MAEITMQSAIENLGLSHLYEIKNISGTYVCPICGDDGKKKLNINFRKNVFNCPRCGFGGSALDFWAYYRNISGSKPDIYHDAGVDYNRVVREGRGEVKASPVKPERKIREIEIAPVKTRNEAYSKLLSNLNLMDKHKENLLERGLSEVAIEDYGYRSAPVITTEPICHRILTEGTSLEGVPGFYRENGCWHFVNYGSGFLIPTRDIEGNIQCLQLRKDRNEGTRYLTVSSADRDFGSKGTTEPHFNPGSEAENRLIITEGPLKADIISHITGIPTLAVLGVLSLSKVKEKLVALRQRGIRFVYIAYDMDMYENVNVRKAYEKLKKIIFSAGIRFATLEWDTQYKGLDDYLNERRKKQHTFKVEMKQSQLPTT